MTSDRFADRSSGIRNQLDGSFLGGFRRNLRVWVAVLWGDPLDSVVPGGADAFPVPRDFVEMGMERMRSSFGTFLKQP